MANPKTQTITEEIQKLQNSYEEADTNTATDEDEKMIQVVLKSGVSLEAVTRFLVLRLREVERDNLAMERRAGTTQSQILQMQARGEWK